MESYNKKQQKIGSALSDAERSLLNFTERVCEIHGQYKGIYLIYYRIFEWLADKLLWRKVGDDGI